MSVRKNLYWAFLQEYSVFFINFIASVIYARLLSPNETGVFGLSYLLVAILMQLRQFGMGTYVVQSADLNDERAASALGVMYIISWTLGFFILLGAPMIASFFKEPRLTTSLYLLSITFFLAPLYQFGMALMERRMQFSRLIWLTLLATLTSVSVGIASAVYGLGYKALPLSYVTYVTTSCLYVLILQPEGNILIPKFTLWREVIGFGSYTSGAGLVGTIGKQMPAAVLGKIAGVTTVGLYSRASGLTDILQSLIVNAITRTVNVALAKNRRDGVPLGPDYLTALGLSTGLAWSAFALLAIVAKPLIYFLYGPQWVQAAPYMSLICIYQMLLLSLVAYSEMMTLNGAFKRLFIYELGLMLFAGFNFYLWARIDPHYGAASRTLEGIIFFGLYSSVLTRLLGITYGNLFAIYGKSISVAAITILPALALNFRLGWPQKMSFLMLTALAVTSGVFWMGGLFAVRHPLAPHVRQLVLQLHQRFITRRA
jgi:O-antigen/teichoic acid export membrane protein